MEIKELSGYYFGKEAKKLKAKTEKEEFNTPTFLQKNLSSIVDVAIVFVMRFLASSILVSLWYAFKLKDIFASIDAEIETKEQIFSKLMQFGIIYEFIIFSFIIIFTGGLYYILMYASKWNATLGCILLDLKLIRKKTKVRISLARSLLRYLLCLMPIFFLTLIIYKVYLKDLDFLFILCIFASAFWYDLSMIFRIHQGVPDLICNTILISTRPPKKKFSFKNFRIFN
jgi:uncharacterized RDD family membrane protein YckC